MFPKLLQTECPNYFLKTCVHTTGFFGGFFAGFPFSDCGQQSPNLLMVLQIVVADHPLVLGMLRLCFLQSGVSSFNIDDPISCRLKGTPTTAHATSSVTWESLSCASFSDLISVSISHHTPRQADTKLQFWGIAPLKHQQLSPDSMATKGFKLVHRCGNLVFVQTTV